jgi:hypothetical protein
MKLKHENVGNVIALKWETMEDLVMEGLKIQKVFERYDMNL